MTQANTVEELHNRAHRAALQAEGENHWWDGSLETGLAAAAGALHPPGASRRIGELGLEGLRKWLDDGDVRAIGEDAAALALGAFAAERLGDGARRFREAALRTLEKVVREAKAPVAPLHLALAAWALRQILPVTDKSPWPELHEKFDQLPITGADSLLVGYGKLLATKEPDARQLARMLQEIPDVDPSEYAILLWALWSGSLLLAELVEDGDPDLEVVRKRRDEVFDAVCVEIRHADVLVEAADDFEPFPDDDRPDFIPQPPDTFEMLMLDLALSRDITGEPLRTPSEVDIVVARRNNWAILFATGSLELVAIVSTALAVVVARFYYEARFGIVFGTGMSTFAALTFPALRVWNIVEKSHWPRRSILDATFTLLLLGVAIVVNWAPKKPLVEMSEFSTIAIGLGGSLGLALLLAVVRLLIEGRKPS